MGKMSGYKAETNTGHNSISVCIDDCAERAVVAMIANLFENVAYVDADTLRHNIRCGCKGGFSRSDRSVPAELAEYLMGRAGLIFLGLIINQDFRDTFMEAVAIECALDTKSPEVRMKVRNDMKGDMPRYSGKSLTIDFSVYDDDIFRMLNGEILKGFERIDAYKDDVNLSIGKLTEDEMVHIGYIVSNFMYLIRAFCRNALFLNYVKTVIDNVKEQLDIS